jgi:aspartate carbamoyltransferase catalytic subunit
VSERAIKKVPTLRGQTIVNLFFEASTRTRISFEFAEKRMSADTVSIASAGSSVSKGETLVDTARNLEAMKIDMVVIRHGSSGAARFLAERIESNVINAGDGTHEHPTQGLLDLLTLREKFGGSLEGRRVCVVGDVLHSRVARSNIHGLRTMGAEVGVCGPRSLLPNAVDALGVTVFDRIEAAIEWAEALNVLRLQLERMQAGYIPSLREYNRVFGVTRERLERAPRDVVILHPGPMNRGVEIDSDVADGPHSVILDQVTNGVAVRMAVLYLLAGGRPSWPRRPRGRAGAGGTRERARRRAGRTRERGRRAGRGAHRHTGAGAATPAHRRSRARPVAGARRGGRGRAARRRARRARRRPDRPPRRRRRGRLHRARGLSRLRRRALPPARAGARGRRDDRERGARGRGGRLHGGVRDAQHRPGHRQPGGRRVHRPPGAARRRRARLPRRRDHAGPEGRDARRVRRDGRRRRGRRERRRQAGGERADDAHGARVRARLRHPGRRPLRGAHARPRRRDERGRDVDAPRPQGDPERGRGDHGHPRHPPRAAAPGGTSTSAT